MLKNFRVPKLQIKAEIIIVNRKSASYKVFLAENRTEGRCERPSEMLNGSRTFLPAVGDDGGIVFLPVNSIIMLSMPASWEFPQTGASLPGSDEEEVLSAELEVDLSDATHVYGTVQYRALDGRTRIQDYLNREDRFLTILQEETVVFVNKHHAARVAPARTR